jgi:hypothetical protein
LSIEIEDTNVENDTIVVDDEYLLACRRVFDDEIADGENLPDEYGIDDDIEVNNPLQLITGQEGFNDIQVLPGEQFQIPAGI